MARSKMRILVVGQTPPPYGGQAVMIERMLSLTYASAELIHVRMAFAKDMDDMGSWRVGKFFHAAALIFQILLLRVVKGADVLYYPPSGPALGPVLRDILILATTRWAFKKTLFHFHASGLSELGSRLPSWIKPFFWIAFGSPSMAICLSEHNPDDAAYIGALSAVIVPNGVPDSEKCIEPAPRLDADKVPTILFVGLICREKGIEDLLAAANLLKLKGVGFRLNVMGKFESPEYRAHCQSLVDLYGIGACVDWLGVKTGGEKQSYFSDSDIFCFPTFFSSESFGLVVVEAMMSGKPVVATAWRGVRGLVVDGETGYLVPINSPELVALRLQGLIEDSLTRMRMGQAGRVRYLNEYSMERFNRNLDEAFEKLRSA